MKIVAETTGDHMLWNSVNNDVVEANKVCVVAANSFWDMKLGQGQLKIHGRVNDDATQEDLDKVMTKKGDKDPSKVVWYEGNEREGRLQAFIKDHSPDSDSKSKMAEEIADAEAKVRALEDAKAPAKEIADAKAYVELLKTEKK